MYILNPEVRTLNYSLSYPNDEYKIFFNSNASLSSTFFLTIDCFKAFLYKRIITLFQSLSLVYFVLNFDIIAFLIKIEIDVNRAVLLVRVMPAVGIIFDKANVVIVEAVPVKVYVIKNKTSFFSVLWTFFDYIHYQSYDFLKIILEHVLQFHVLIHCFHHLWLFFITKSDYQFSKLGKTFIKKRILIYYW